MTSRSTSLTILAAIAGAAALYLGQEVFIPIALGLMMTSLMVPNSVPELPVTCAPVNWLARNSCRPMRPVGLKCPPVQPD